MKYLERFPSYIDFRDRRKESNEDVSATETIAESSKTPEELIEESYKEIQAALIPDPTQDCPDRWSHPGRVDDRS